MKTSLGSFSGAGRARSGALLHATIIAWSAAAGAAAAPPSIAADAISHASGPVHPNPEAFANENPDRSESSAVDAQSKEKGGSKLGSPGTDQVFVAISPCRIVDTRLAGGPISAGATRNFKFYANTAAFDWSQQGGSFGSAGTTCPQTVNPNGGAPSAAVVTVTVVSPTAPGNWIIWGGDNPKPTISALNWNAGGSAANTTIIPRGSGAGSGPGGPVKDFAVSYNGPSGSAHLVADVVGYLVENRATALDCYETPLASTTIASNASAAVSANACDSGWTLVGGNCDADNYNNVIINAQYYSGPFPQAFWTCIYHNSGATQNIYATSICCRVPGR